MSRFSRYSRISPLALCLEAERRAWRSGVALFSFLLPGAVWALVCPAPEGRSFAAGECDFTGIHVAAEKEFEPVQAERVVVPLPAAPVVDCVPEVPFVASPRPQLVQPPEWEVEEFEEEPLLVLELPEELPVPRSASAPARREGRGEPATSGSAAAAEAGPLQAASYRSTPPPPYPPSLLNLRAEGRVGLRIVVDAEGVPQEVEVVSASGYAAFDRCAREWVRTHWRFHPARRGGVAVTSVVRTQLEFVLH